MSKGFTGVLNTTSSMTLWQQVKETAVPIVTYWLWLGFSFAVFAASVLVTDGVGTDNLVALGIFIGVTSGAVAAGQLLAFLRVRTWLLILGGAICWAVYFGVFVGMAVGGAMPEPLIVLSVAVLLIGPVAITGGLWSLETHRALWSAWLPMVYTVAGMLIWMEDQGTVDAWKTGDKLAVWDLVGLAMFVPSVGLFLLFLVTRETHRLATWRRGPMAPLRPTMEERGVSRPRLTLLGFIALGLLTLFVSGASALVAPFLWRTGPDEGSGGGGQPSSEPQPPPDLPDMPGIDPRVMEMVQKMVEAAQQAAGSVCTMLAIGLLALLGALIAYRPLKRLLVVRHLKDPYWTVSPTQRIEQGWRLVEIALGDAGVFPVPGEDAASLARRAAPVLARLSPVEVHGFDDVAEVADRVRFGLGVSPGDVETVERFSRWVMDTVWERLDDKTQVASMYRGI
ncbi:MAG: hypothetical protein FJ102_19250 [Deltaproteobacteria bacterium]|nr:hypothetical protein [Deltaproteobacteria bacterium]